MGFDDATARGSSVLSVAVYAVVYPSVAWCPHRAPPKSCRLTSQGYSSEVFYPRPNPYHLNGSIASKPKIQLLRMTSFKCYGWSQAAVKTSSWQCCPENWPDWELAPLGV